jgi:hypothetical protein
VAPLPESLQEESHAKTAAAAKQHRGGMTTARKIVIGGLLGTGLLAAMWAGTVFFRHEPDPGRAWVQPHQPQVTDSSPPVPATSAPGSREDSPSAAWRDGAAEHILELSTDADELEQRASRLWDNSPITSTPEPSP